jgi:glycosyl transferase, family 25
MHSNAKRDLSLTFDQIQIHLIHYTPMLQRRDHMREVLSQAEILEAQVNWLTDWDREAIMPTYLKGFYGDPNQLQASHVSVILKHLAVFAQAADSAVPYHLVIEDDIYLEKPFQEKLLEQISQLPKNWEMLFVGDGCDLHIPFWRRRWGKQVYLREPQARWWGGGGISRCAAGYLIHPASARRFLSSQHAQAPFTVPIDWLMNRVGSDLNVRTYWSEPPLVKQGAFDSWTKDRKLNPIAKS